jgi:trehalose 6-phosphate phosphatase
MRVIRRAISNTAVQPGGNWRQRRALPVAVISGRALADVDRILGALHLPVSGSHGLEFRLSAAREDAPMQSAGVPTAVIDRVEEFAVLHGVTSERKPGAIAA